MKKTSDYIKEIRALRDLKPDGEQIPNIYEAHYSAMQTERQLAHARCLVAELYALLEGSVEGPGLDPVREDEIAGLLLLWQSQQSSHP
jgi:hypothetical protein